MSRQQLDPDEVAAGAISDIRDLLEEIAASTERIAVAFERLAGVKPAKVPGCRWCVDGPETGEG